MLLSLLETGLRPLAILCFHKYFVVFHPRLPNAEEHSRPRHRHKLHSKAVLIGSLLARSGHGFISEDCHRLRFHFAATALRRKPPTCGHAGHEKRGNCYHQHRSPITHLQPSGSSLGQGFILRPAGPRDGRFISSGLAWSVHLPAVGNRAWREVGLTRRRTDRWARPLFHRFVTPFCPRFRKRWKNFADGFPNVFLWRPEECLECSRETAEVLVQWWRNRIEPLQTAEVKLQIVVRSHVLDAELNNVQTRIGSQLQFAQDLWGIIRIR